MFSYVDKKIRERLENSDRLVTLNREGKPAKSGDEFISLLGPIPIPRLVDGREVVLQWYPFVRRVQLGHVLHCANKVSSGSEDFRELLQENMSVNSILATDGFLTHPSPLVRIHSCCMTGDVFGSLRCECGPQLEHAFRRIADEQGAVIYMSGHEGRGIGLWAKAVTYLLQDEGQDTYQANTSLGLPEDSRDFTDAAVVLRYLLKGKAIRLLSNNPLKYDHLVKNGQPIQESLQHVAGLGDHNIRYMKAKKIKGHNLPDL